MWVRRDGSTENLISGAFFSRQPGMAEEEISNGDSELLDFLNNNDFYKMPLNDYKEFRISEINEQIREYVYSRYALHRQITFTNILLEARSGDISNQKPNRAVYVDAVWTWIQSVFAYYYVLQNTIINAPDKNTVMAVAVDQAQLNAFTAADPVRTIEAALAIQD